MMTTTLHTTEREPAFPSAKSIGPDNHWIKVEAGYDELVIHFPSRTALAIFARRLHDAVFGAPAVRVGGIELAPVGQEECA